MSKKDKKDKKEKKTGRVGGSKVSALAALAQNPVVADVVASALVATAAALKDSKRARALASEAGDELAKLSRTGAKAGDAFWEMALEIGRRSIDALGKSDASAKKSKGKSRPARAGGSTKRAATAKKKK